MSAALTLALLVIAMPAQGQRPAGPNTPNRPTGTVQVATPEPEKPPPTDAVITGLILDASSKTPLARARVKMSADCETPTTDPAKPCKKVLENDRITITSEDGRYRFDQLPAGTTYVIRAVRTGYAPQGFGELPPGQAPRLIPLKVSQTLDNITIELAPEVVIAGIVQDEDGKPLSGAYVEAQRATYLDGRRELLTAAEATTNDRGEFRLSQMSPGQYYVSASDPAFSNVGDASGPLFWPPTYYPSASTPEDATRITLDPGVAQEQIVIKLHLVRPSRIGGKLQANGGEELISGGIELGPRLADQGMSLSTHKADIKPDGSYLFANVSPGRYVIRARGDSPAVPQSMFGNYNLEVLGVDQNNVNVLMAPGALVSGTVEWEGRARQPADKSTIVIRAPLVDGSLSGDSVTGNLMPDDSFKLRGVLSALHYIRVEGLPEAWSLKSVQLKGADVTDIPVDFRTGQIEDTLRVILTDTSAVVSGTVTVGSHDVLHGYAVVAFSINPTVWFPRSRYVALSRPNLRGRYFFRGLPAGEYYIVATRDVDDGDLGNGKALQKLADAAGVRRLTIKENQVQLFDVRAAVKRSLGNN